MPDCVRGFSERATRALLRATPWWILLTLSLAGAGWAQPAIPPAGQGAATGAAADWTEAEIRASRVETASAGTLPGSGTAFDWNGSRALALPNRERAAIDVIDLRTWQLVKSIATPGPGSFVRGHEGSPYLWADAIVAGHSNGALIAIDKQTLQVAAALKDPSLKLAHVSFTHSGRHMLASLNEAEGALVGFDAATLKEFKRLPMRLPTRSYNVGNQIKHPDYDPSP